MSSSFSNNKSLEDQSSDEELVSCTESDEDNAIPDEKPKAPKRDRHNEELRYVTKDFKTTIRLSHFEGKIIHKVMTEGADEKTLPFKMKAGRSRPRVAPTTAELKRKQATGYTTERFTKSDFFETAMTGTQYLIKKAQYQAETNPAFKEKRKAYYARKVWLSKDLICSVPIEDTTFDFKDPTTFPFKKGNQVRYQPHEFFSESVTRNHANALRKKQNVSQCWVLEKYNEHTQKREAIELICSARDDSVESLKAAAREKILKDPNYKQFTLRFMRQRTYYAAKQHQDKEFRLAKNKRIQNNRKTLVPVDKDFQLVDTVDDKTTDVTYIPKSTHRKALELMAGKKEAYTRFLVRVNNPKIVEKVFTDEKEALNAIAFLKQHPEFQTTFTIITRDTLSGHDSQKKPNAQPTRKRRIECLQPLRDHLTEELGVTATVSDEVKAIFTSALPTSSSSSLPKQAPPKKRRIPKLGESATTASPSHTTMVRLVLPSKATELGTLLGESLARENKAFDEKVVKEAGIAAVSYVTVKYYVDGAKAAYDKIKKLLKDPAKKGREKGQRYAKTHRVMPDLDPSHFKNEKNLYSPESFSLYLKGVEEGAMYVLKQRSREMGELRAFRDVCLLKEPRSEHDNELKREAKFYKVNFGIYYENYKNTFPGFKHRRATVLAAKKLRDAKDLDMLALKNKFELSDKAILTTSPHFKEEFEAIHGIPYIPGDDQKYKLIIDIEPAIPGQFGLYAAERIKFPFVTKNQLKKLILIEYTGQISTAKDYIAAPNSEQYRMEFEINNIPTQIDAAICGNAARFANHAEEALLSDEKEVALIKANTFYFQDKGRTYIAGVPGRIVEPGQRIGVPYKIPPANAVTLSTQSGLIRKPAPPSILGHFSQKTQFMTHPIYSPNNPKIKRG